MMGVEGGVGRRRNQGKGKWKEKEETASQRLTPDAKRGRQVPSSLTGNGVPTQVQAQAQARDVECGFLGEGERESTT